VRVSGTGAPAPGAVVHLTRADVERLVSPRAAMAAIAGALAAGASRHIARTSVELSGGELLLMPAESRSAAGVKVLALATAPAPGAPMAAGVYVVFDAESLAPVAVLDAAALTELRTAAVSAWATDALARPDASVLVLFGTGAQARAHLRALAAVRPLRRVLVVGRDPARVEALVELAGGLALDASAAGPQAVAGADLVCCCTSSADPLFDGRLLREETHVVAVGSHRPERREVDTETVVRSAVVVEDRASALAAGDLGVPAREGRFSPRDVAADLFELASGLALDRSGRPTLFKSVGMGFEDLAVARAAVAEASRAPR